MPSPHLAVRGRGLGTRLGPRRPGAPGCAPTIRPHQEQSVARGVVQELWINNQYSIVCRDSELTIINGREVGRLAYKLVAYSRNNH